MKIRVIKARILWKNGIMACCSQMCDKECPNWNKCYEHQIIILDSPGNSSRYFSNIDCEYYPCHGLERQNCLFCYCPLHHMKDCGGNYSILPNGCKDCSECLLPHGPDGWQYIIDRLKLNPQNQF